MRKTPTVRPSSRYAVMALHSSAMKGSISAIVAMNRSLLKELADSADPRADPFRLVLSGILKEALEAKTAIDKLHRSLQKNKGNGDGTATRLR